MTVATYSIADTVIVAVLSTLSLSVTVGRRSNSPTPDSRSVLTSASGTAGGGVNSGESRIGSRSPKAAQILTDQRLVDRRDRGESCMAGHHVPSAVVAR